VPTRYFVFAINTYGCEEVDDVFIDVIEDIQSTLAITLTAYDVSCFGNCNGVATVSATGGDAPYSYSWSNGATDVFQFSLCPEDYTVSVTDASGCTADTGFTINEPVSALLVAGTTTETSCSGDPTGTISLSIDGGTLPYSFEWSNGSSEQNQTELATGAYSAIVSDAAGCSSMWSTTVQMLSKAILAGNISYSQGYIDAEDATVYLMDASGAGHKEIAQARTQENGFFQFLDLPEGSYYIKVKIDNHGADNKKYQGVIPSYYNTTHKWKEAAIIQLSCMEMESINVEMFENPSASDGNGKVSGSCNLKDNSGVKAVYYALPDADVFLIDNTTGLPVAYVSTTADGLYEISGIPNGDYSLYVDITGITQTSTYHISISDNELEHTGLDFEVDLDIDMEIYTINNSVDIGDMAMEQFDLTAYPNPARTFVKLRSELFADQDIKTTLISSSGATVNIQEFTPLEINNHEIEFYLPAISPGSYMMVVQVGELIQVKNIIVIQ
jgi:hypothetical protein